MAMFRYFKLLIWIDDIYLDHLLSLRYEYVINLIQFKRFKNFL